MIPTLLRIGWTNLKRDRVAQALTFLLPIVFFSIFASVFGGQRDSTSRISVAVADDDGSEVSRRIVGALGREQPLRLRTTIQASGGAALNRASAEQLVKNGDVPIALVIPRGFGAEFVERAFSPGGPAVQLLADPSDPIASQVVVGLLQKVVLTGTPDVLAASGLRRFEQNAGPMTAQQREAVGKWLPQLRSEAASGGGGAATSNGMAVPVTIVDVMRAGNTHGSLISFYAAGIGVMFLLFSSVSGAGGALLDESESGTLERLLSTNVGMTGLLAGKWIFLSLVGCAQLCVMFLWGWIAFKLPLFSHVAGFAIMTVATACAASALGLVLATLARTRAQLSGFSTMLILSMSAVGGSMFPRFLMSETMQRFGLFTFNAWALDGYLKVFWRQAPLWQLWPQLVVLTSLTAVFLVAARILARRWETA